MFFFQDNVCVTTMKNIPPGEIIRRVHIADRSDIAPQRLMPGKVTQLINAKATIMSLTSRYQSKYHLQAN